MTETLNSPILLDKTTFWQTLPISQNNSKFDTELLTAPKTLKDFSHKYKHKKEIFNFDKRHGSIDTNLPSKIFFLWQFHSRCFFCLFLQIILILLALLAMYLLCKHKKLRILVTSIASQQIREVGAVTMQEDVIINTYSIQYYTILALSITLLGLVLYAVLHSRKF